LAVIIKTE